MRKAQARRASPGKAETRAERNIRWVEEKLRVPEGRNVGKPLRLAPFMKDDFRAIYDNPHGTRRAIISRGRKNAKTTESAMILLLHLCGPEMRPNSQLFSAAQSRDQAAILFALAAKMVRLSPELSAYVNVRDTAKQLHCAELGTLYRALSADASTAYGLSPVLIVHDELGQVKGPKSELYEALETATAAQDEPLSIVISTQAPTEADLLSVLIDDAMTGADPRTVLRFQTAAMELDPFSEEAIRAANPAFDEFMNKAEVLAMAADAKRMPSRQPEYENLVLNRRVEAQAPFIARPIWLANTGDGLADFKGLPVYGGLDLSETNDLTALVLVAPDAGVWHVRPTFWLPAEGLRDRSRKDRVPYDTWASQGHLTTVPGRSIDYEWVAYRLREVFDLYDVRSIAFDRWNFKHLKPWLEKAGFTEEELARFVEFGQGFVSMSPALRELEASLLNEKIAHGAHPVLTMCAANAVVQTDPAGNRKLSKSRSRGRIDGMVALAMAMATAATHSEAPPFDPADWIASYA
ncbi:terminase [Methylobacterium sp. Leaf399]|uniref:terminase large subunit n=1 Tax=Methylobacterium sp. Leaf399 TaxID=1736364 RepID=UPI0006F5EC67|nr:terminase TerL endonuclease subunit [Methylobacterium sp. Leaf399]KQT08517.1 terminase [Methylobacterium sp. Leaf399]